VITIKKKHNIQNDTLNDLISKFNNVVRFSYARKIKDGIDNLSDLEKIVKSSMENIEILDASWIKCAVKVASDLHTDKKLYFGGKSNFFKRKFNKISGYNKDFPLEMRGSSNDKGNRKAKLSGNTLIIKPYKGLEIPIDLKLSRREQRMLNIISEQAMSKQNYFNFEIDQEHVWISFNPPVMSVHEFRKDRYLGIDLNPNWIAVSIMDIGKEVYKELIDIRLLNKSSKTKKYYEMVSINKHIIGLCKHYRVEYVCLEDLSISSSNKGLGKNYNRLVNGWNRNGLVNNLVKHLTISDIKYLMVNPYYTSFMGQIKNNKDYDSIAASKEVAYRGFMVNKGLIKGYVNDFLGSLVATRWKEMLPQINTYKDLYDHYKIQKKSKNSYRFLFNDQEKGQWSYFRLGSNKSMIDLIIL